MSLVNLNLLLGAVLLMTGCATTPPPSFHNFDEFGVFNNPAGAEIRVN